MTVCAHLYFKTKEQLSKFIIERWNEDVPIAIEKRLTYYVVSVVEVHL